MEIIYTAVDNICAILVAGVLAMIAFSHKEHQAARWMLFASSVLIILRWTMWSFTTESPWWVRGIIGALFGALLLGLAPALWQWSKEKIASDNLPVSAQNTTEANSAKTEKPKSSTGISIENSKEIKMNNFEVKGYENSIDISNSTNVSAKNFTITKPPIKKDY